MTNQYRVYEDDGYFYPQIKGKLWGWNYLWEEGVFSRYIVRKWTLQEARIYIEDCVKLAKSNEEYKNREIVRRYHY